MVFRPLFAQLCWGENGRMHYSTSPLLNPGRNSCQLKGTQWIETGREQGRPALTALKIKIVALWRDRPPSWFWVQCWYYEGRRRFPKGLNLAQQFQKHNSLALQKISIPIVSINSSWFDWLTLVKLKWSWLYIQ